MQKISKHEIIDIIDYNDHAIIFVEKLPLIENMAKFKVNYLVYDFDKKIRA